MSKHPSYADQPPPLYLQVVKETTDVQSLLGSVPVVVGADVLEAGISEHSVVVLLEQQGETDHEPRF